MMKEKIDKWLNKFTEMTREEGDYIAEILKWDDGERVAFMLAKNLFDGWINDKQTQRVKRKIK